MIESISLLKERLDSVNILVVGKTGSGKSTLINSVLGSYLAVTGIGKPVTQVTNYYSVNGNPISLIDTKGFELQDEIYRVEDFLSVTMQGNALQKRVNAVWLCIQEDCRRVDNTELRLCDIFKNLSIPVVIVVTKSRFDNGFSEYVKSVFTSASAVVSIRSIPELIQNESKSFCLKEKGLDILINKTSDLVFLYSK